MTDNTETKTKLRDPQDTVLLLSLVALAVFVVIQEVEWAEVVVGSVITAVATKIGTTGARPGSAD